MYELSVVTNKVKLLQCCNNWIEFELCWIKVKQNYVELVLVVLARFFNLSGVLVAQSVCPSAVCMPSDQLVCYGGSHESLCKSNFVNWCQEGYVTSMLQQLN